MDSEKYQTGLKRLWAAIVDGIVFLPLVLVEQWIYKSTTNFIIHIAWAVFVFFIPLLYSIILHCKTGQTIGKWAAGVIVLDVSETRMLTLQQSIYRDSFYLLVAIIGAGYFSFQLVSSGDLENILSNLSRITDNLVLCWVMLELISMLTNSKRRAIHDYLAQSIVVRKAASGKHFNCKNCS